MKKLLLMAILTISLFAIYSSAVAQPPSYYGYGDDDYQEYMDDLRDYVNAGGIIPTKSPAQIKEEKKQEDEIFHRKIDFFAAVFWIGLIVLAHKKANKSEN